MLTNKIRELCNRRKLKTLLCERTTREPKGNTVTEGEASKYQGREKDWRIITSRDHESVLGRSEETRVREPLR